LRQFTRHCRGRGDVFVACPSARETADILNLGGDALAYYSHWTRPWSHTAHQTNITTKMKYRTCGVCALATPNSFWPWGVFSPSDKDTRFDYHVEGLRSIGRMVAAASSIILIHSRMPVTLSRGDGARSEPDLLACTCQPSSMFLTDKQFNVEVLRICALGCGEASKDGGFEVFLHADEGPCILASWFSLAFILRVRLWRVCHQLAQLQRQLSAMLRARCASLKCATREAYFIQGVGALRPIDFASWAGLYDMPHVLEPKRPSKSDPEDAVLILIWWLRFAKLRSTDIAKATLLKQEVAP